jgi:hypothetical protein
VRTSLTDDLTVEYGDTLPPALIARTVQAAADAPDAGAGPGAVERTARADVAALAEAVRRGATTPGPA